jgi:hypothetical protein
MDAALDMTLASNNQSLTGLQTSLSAQRFVQQEQTGRTCLDLDLLGSPNLFSNANGFHIGGGQFVLGDVHNHPAEVSVFNFALFTSYVNSSSQDHPAFLYRGTSWMKLFQSEIYCNQLLRRKRGFPLYVPEPRQNLPAEYWEHGVAIGDVGRITPEGVFDFFFNIYLPADHPINDNDVPEYFYPLLHYTSKRVLDLNYAPGYYVSTSSIQKLDLHPPFPWASSPAQCDIYSYFI